MTERKVPQRPGRLDVPEISSRIGLQLTDYGGLLKTIAECVTWRRIATDEQTVVALATRAEFTGNSSKTVTHLAYLLAAFELDLAFDVYGHPIGQRASAGVRWFDTVEKTVDTERRIYNGECFLYGDAVRPYTVAMCPLHEIE